MNLELKKVAIMVIEWELPLFEEALRNAGFSYAICAAPVPGRLTLAVMTYQIEALRDVVARVVGECDMIRLNVQTETIH